MEIVLSNLSKVFHDGERNLTIIEDLTFSFPNQGSMAIVGRSGVGKSTLLHLMAGLDRPTQGQVLYDGRPLGALSEDLLAEFRGQHVGFVFQSPNLLPEFTALENVMLPLIIGGVGDAEAARRASEILCRVGLKERLSHRPGEISGGESQRVAIARALVREPAVVLADEPTGNLDLNSARDVQAVLLELNAELKNLLVIVTHSLELARSLDAVYEMKPGGNLERV
jgi:lipoprotein-releasing system ATP-binding protein